VVLITDGALDALEEAWPASYGFHAQVLTALSVHQPKAVMIDLLFKDRRRDETLPQLERALRRLREQNIPVYVAAGSSNGNAVRSELAPFMTAVPVPKLTDRFDRATREYPLLLRDYGSTTPTAALRLYEDLRLDGSLSDMDVERDFSDPMQIFWGTVPPAQQGKWIDCHPPPGGALAAAWRRLFGGQDAVQTDCYYALTLPVDSLFTRASDPHLAALIRGKVVFYGAALLGIEDRVYPPTHTSLPGVFMHAMALDNLITFGPDYLRRPVDGSALGRWRSLLEALVLAAYGAMLGLRDDVRSGLRSRHARSVIESGFGQVVALTVGSILVGLAFSLVATLWAWRLQHMAAINWLGCLGAALAIMMAKEWAVRFGYRSKLLNRY
jgi:CHASE2 domain-containing sensor protein